MRERWEKFFGFSQSFDRNAILAKFESERRFSTNLCVCLSWESVRITRRGMRANIAFYRSLSMGFYARSTVPISRRLDPLALWRRVNKTRQCRSVCQSSFGELVPPGSWKDRTLWGSRSETQLQMKTEDIPANFGLERAERCERVHSPRRVGLRVRWIRRLSSDSSNRKSTYSRCYELKRFKSSDLSF